MFGHKGYVRYVLCCGLAWVFLAGLIYVTNDGSHICTYVELTHHIDKSIVLPHNIDNSTSPGDDRKAFDIKDQGIRIALLRNYCRIHRRTAQYSFDINRFAILVDGGNRVAYCEVPKVASTTLIGFFRKKTGGPKGNHHKR